MTSKKLDGLFIESYTTHKLLFSQITEQHTLDTKDLTKNFDKISLCKSTDN